MNKKKESAQNAKDRKNKIRARYQNTDSDTATFIPATCAPQENIYKVSQTFLSVTVNQCTDGSVCDTLS